jgi:hypothetical protein
METLWKSVVELSGRQRVLYLFMPTAIFLAGLGALYIDAEIGWLSFLQWWYSLATEIQLALVVIALIFIIVCATPFDAFTLTFLRWAEGYWDSNRLFRWFYELGRKHHRQVVEKSQKRFSELRDKQDKELLSYRDERRVQQLEELLHYYPPNPQRVMPTLLGNILRAAEDHARIRYGLDPIVTWVRLYPSINSTIQNALEKSSTILNFEVRLIAQITFFAIIGVVLELVSGNWLMSILVLIVGWIVMYLAYQAAIQDAKSYGELIRAAFDLHRFDLYHSLHMPLPTQNGNEEREKGDMVTRFLWRGDADVHYKHVAE